VDIAVSLDDLEWRKVFAYAGCPAHSLVTIPTMLSLLLIFCAYKLFIQ